MTETHVKSLLFAAALALTGSAALAQAPTPETAPAAPAASAAPAAKAVRKPVVRAAPAAVNPVGTMEISQIVGIRMIDAATYEIDAKAQNGAPVKLRMNAFVMQDLGRQLGTYGK